MIVDPTDINFGTEDGFTLGALADSVYEYLPKVSTGLPLFRGGMIPYSLTPKPVEICASEPPYPQLY